MWFKTRGVTYSKNSGEFECPICKSKQSYSKKEVRRFVTVAVIPVLPLNVMANYIECQKCQSTFREEILQLGNDDPKVREAQFHLAMKQVMVHMMMADGRIEDEELDTICMIYENLSGKALTRDDVKAEIQNVESSGESLIPFLEGMLPYLNRHSREFVMRAALSVAAADRVFNSKEHRLVKALGRVLMFTNTEVEDILESVGM